MRLMNLQAVVPSPHTIQPHPAHALPVFAAGSGGLPAQLRVVCRYHLRAAARGFLYLVAVLDWFSRYVLSWPLSNTLEARFCLEAVEQALASGQPQIFNTDQGSQFTGPAFTATRRGQDPDQHGWSRPSAGQRLRGAALADCEVRGGLSARLRRWSRTLSGFESVLCVLSHGAPPPEPDRQTPAEVHFGESGTTQAI